jgi:hypothetical protein
MDSRPGRAQSARACCRRSSALGAIVLTLLWTWVAVSFSLGMRINGRPLGRDPAFAEKALETIETTWRP